MQYYRYDKTTGDYIEPVIIDDIEETPIPDNVTATAPHSPCYRPQWDGSAWVEAAPKPSIDQSTETAIWDGDTRVWSVAPIPEPELSDNRIAEIALTAVSELAEKLSVTLDSIPEAVAERVEERRVIESRMKAL